jgi:hypothetical protein
MAMTIRPTRTIEFIGLQATNTIGYIVQYLGDGLLVYFGYPQAHEDDARRAVHTGLALLEAMWQLNIRLEQERRVQLAVRVGIHTGLVVVGEMGGEGRHERLALGDTPNLAARLQGLAEPDTVVVSADTLRLVEGYIRYKDLGPQAFKGVDTPVAVYRVLGEGTAQSRLEVTAAHGWTPLVGREAEVALLRERWAQVTEGLGQVILVQGETGIGKSRLVQVLKEHVAETPHTALECRGSPYHQHSALYPVIELWQRVWQCASGGGPGGETGKAGDGAGPVAPAHRPDRPASGGTPGTAAASGPLCSLVAAPPAAEAADAGNPPGPAARADRTTAGLADRRRPALD